MTTASEVVQAPSPSRVGRWLAGPQQGWSSLVLLLVMLAVTGLAIDEQRWMGISPGGASQTGMLPVLMVGAGITGALLSWTRLSLGWVDLIAAIIGTAAGLLLAATAISDASSLSDQLRNLNASLAQFLADVLVRAEQTEQTSAFLITVSALAWTSGVFAGISIFRRSNAAGAIVPIGAILMLEIVASRRAQDLWLVIFAGASLLLVLRLDLEAQREHWLRRRIGGGHGVGSLYLRGGAVVVALMLAGSTLLATTASSTSMAGTFPQLDALIDDLAFDLQGFVGASPSDTAGSSGQFPERRRISNSWSTDTTPVFEVQTDDGGGHYWRGATYDAFDGKVWARTTQSFLEVPAFEDLLGTSTDAVVGGDYYQDVVATVTSSNLAGIQLPAPANPISVDRDTRVTLTGEDGPFQVLEAVQRVGVGEEYEVTGREPVTSGEFELTVNRLLAGGTAYDDWLGPYYGPDSGRAGPATVRAARALKERLPQAERDAYHVAKAVQDMFTARPGRFTYDTNLGNICRDGETTSDCLLRTERGFCQQYATTMVMMLRSLDIPARYVEGYLPGRSVDDRFVVDGSMAHAWVEVWFNDVGWIRFDPTPGGTALAENGQEMTALVMGDPVPSEGPDSTGEPGATDPASTDDPFASPGPDESFEPEVSPPPDAAAGAGTMGGPSTWLLLIGGIVGALLLVGGAAVLWFRRFPGREPDFAWRGIVSLASRLGMGPRPSQTPYEYTVTLSKAVPRVAKDLRAVAEAKVDATYAGPTPPAVSEDALRHAYRRARTGLLRLTLRRGRR